MNIKWRQGHSLRCCGHIKDSLIFLLGGRQHFEQASTIWSGDVQKSLPLAGVLPASTALQEWVLLSQRKNRSAVLTARASAVTSVCHPVLLHLHCISPSLLLCTWLLEFVINIIKTLHFSGMFFFYPCAFLAPILVLPGNISKIIWRIFCHLHISSWLCVFLAGR